MILFDDIERTDPGPQRETEPDFAFVNRSARPLFSKTRELLEEWFANVSDQGHDKKDMRARFRSNDEKPHVGAFFELYCHGLLKYQAYDVDLHQSADASTSRVPDFSASRFGEQLFYLESTLAADTFIDEKSRARLQRFVEGLAKLDSRNYGISMDYDEGPKHQPSGKEARRFLKEKLDRLEEWAERNSSWPAGDHIRWEYDDQDWKVYFSPILRPAEDRGKPGQRLILMGVSGGEINPETSLYASIKRKAGAYGNLTEPYVVAVNTADEFAGENDVVDSLLGRITYRAFRNTGGADRRVFASRDPKSGAAFLDPYGNPTNTRVSAVLVAYALKVSRLVTCETPMLWHNPWAKTPLDPKLWQGPQVFIDPGTFQLTKQPGFDYREHLRNRLDYRDPFLDD